LVEAVQRMPENEEFSRRIEFSDLIRHYFPFPLDHAMMLIYHVYLMLTLMTYIIQSGQVVDYIILDSFGCAPGLRLSVDGGSHLICGTHRDSVTPFGEEAILSSSMCIIVLVCIPLAMKNLDDNILLQWAAIVGLSVMAAYWAVFMASQPNFPHALPAVTSSQTSLVGTVLFNFAFMSALPSWLNEKRPGVPVARSFGYVVAVYTALGVLGGMALPPLSNSGQNLFSKLNESGSVVAQSSVALYPILQNFTSIPVLAIFIRYNLQASGLSRGLATFVAFGVPWLLSIPFYTGRGLDAIAETGGLATSSVINFLVPSVAALRAWLAMPREKICEI
ncbi:SPAC1F5.02, partial [Symbiodinium microadriaticum]